MTTGMNYFFVIHGSERVYPDETVSLDNLYLKRRYILLGYRMTAKFLKYLSNSRIKATQATTSYARCFFVQSKFTWVGPEILYQLATRLSHCSLEGYDVQVEAGFYCDSHLQKN